MRPSEETAAALLEWVKSINVSHTESASSVSVKSPDVVFTFQVRSFGGNAATLGSLEELCDGICLNEILTEM
jgi:hypothetical protein